MDRDSRPSGWPHRLVAAISLVVPAEERDTWRREWDGELAFVLRRAGTDARPERLWLARRLFSASHHAIWLRWHRFRFETLAQDLRYAGRALIRRPAVTTAAVLTLALGIAANTAIYGAVRAVLWRPLPYPEPGRLVIVSSLPRTSPDRPAPNSVSPPNFVDWRRDATVFAASAAVNDGGYALTGDGPAEQVTGAAVTGGFFDVFGVRPIHGRPLAAADDVMGGPEVVVLGHGLWTRRFGGRPDLVGRRIVLDGVAREVVGIMPADLDFPLGADVWVPLRFTVNDLTTQRGANYLTVVGRLRAEASLEAARAEMLAISARIAATLSNPNQGGRAVVHPLRDAIVGDVRPAMRLLAGAVALVFLIACVNVASLVLGAAIGRTSDFALRAALGASRMRLIRSLFVEILLLAAAGGALGMLAAFTAAGTIASIDTAGIPLLDQTRVDMAVGLFTVAATAVAGFVVGLIPALHVSRADVVVGLRSSFGKTTADRHRTRTRSAFVTAQIALAVALLVGAALLGRTFLTLARVDLGIDVERVQTVSILLPDERYKAPARRAAFVNDLVAAILARPEVEAAGAIFGLPLSGFNYYISVFERDGRRLSQDEQAQLLLQLRVATPDLFRALGVRLARGRELSAADVPGSPPVVILNERAAELLWPGEDALGRRVTLGTRLGLGGDRVGGEVVGIVADVRDVGPALPARPTLYAAHAQFPVDFLGVAVKTRGEPGDLVGALRSTVASLDPDLPLFRIRTMEQLAGAAIAQPKLYSTLLAMFAAVAIILASVGVYGAIAHSVAVRTREIGIRMALGATRGEVAAIVLRRATVLALLGIALGVCLVVAAGPHITRVLVGVGAIDLPTFAVVAAAMLGVSWIASWVPARRASRVDPVKALRSE